MIRAASRPESSAEACHYRKLRPDTRTPFDQLMLSEAGVLSNSLHIARTAGNQNETRSVSSLPRKARPMDKKRCFGLENSAPSGVEVEGTEAYQIWWRERLAKQRAVRIDGAGRQPEEWQRYDRSPVCLRLSA